MVGGMICIVLVDPSGDDSKCIDMNYNTYQWQITIRIDIGLFSNSPNIVNVQYMIFDCRKLEEKYIVAIEHCQYRRRFIRLSSK